MQGERNHYTRSLACMWSFNFGSRLRVRSLRRTDTSGERTHTHKCCLSRTVRKLSALQTEAQQARSRRRSCLGPATRQNAHIFRMQSDLKCQRGSSMTHQWHGAPSTNKRHPHLAVTSGASPCQLRQAQPAARTNRRQPGDINQRSAL